MKTILVTDDNENNRYLLDKLLTGYGFKALLAKNGAEALETARKHRPDLIVTDILMPVMDGFELCRQWKNDKSLKNIPFVVYTATYTDLKDEKLMLDLGADRFMVKPQKPEAIMEVIFDVLEKVGTSHTAAKPLGDEMEALRQYNSVLFNKLEKKMADLQNEITERTQAEEKLAWTVEALKRSNAELEQFAYATFHDLQEPLRVLSLYTQLLKKRYSEALGSEALEYIEIIIQGSLRMSALIKDIIDYSKLGKAEKEFKQVDMNEAAAEAMKIFQMRIRELNASVSCGKLPQVMGDMAELVQLFSNLIGNALKFTKKGQAPVIEISAALKGEEWEFCVRDKGIGINPKYFDKIFVLFQTLHSKQEYDGSGVGLAICKKIVEDHGGRIWVESGEGKGACFCFVLPAIKQGK